jgi:hypothetical protein
MKGEELVDLPSFPSALQLRMSFGLQNNLTSILLYSEADWFPNSLVFMA